MKILGEKALTWSSKSGLDKLTDKFFINNTTWKGSKGNPLFASFNSIVLAWNQPFLEKKKGKKKDGWTMTTVLNKMSSRMQSVVVGTSSHRENHPGSSSAHPITYHSCQQAWPLTQNRTNKLHGNITLMYNIKSCVHRIPFLNA